MSLAARALEEAGIPTVIIGSAVDIVEHCGVPRYAFTDFPLGNPCGKPWDRKMQLAIVERAVALFDDAREPGAMLTAPFQWGDGVSWRSVYGRVDDSNREALKAAGAARRAERAALPKRP